MAIQPETKTFIGRNGETQYISYPLSFKAGYELGIEIAGLLTPVMGTAVGSLFGVDSESAPSPGQEFGRLPQRLMEMGGVKLVTRILGTTMRVDEGKKRKLSDEEELTNAFAGNYGELFAVIWWVLGVNYAPFGMAENSEWGEVLSELRTLASPASLLDWIRPSTTEQDESNSTPSSEESD